MSVLLNARYYIYLNSSRSLARFERSLQFCIKDLLKFLEHGIIKWMGGGADDNEGTFVLSGHYRGLGNFIVLPP